MVLYQTGSLQVTEGGPVVAYGRIVREPEYDDRKEQIVHYWEKRSESFLEQRRSELANPIAKRWMKEIEKQIPAGRRLKILDVGCGAGFFSILLAKEGHEVFGIDLTPDMIEHAEHMAAVLGLDATFRIMDAENPDFEPESFDVLVTRNLTWTLPHVEKAYREWYRILKPGGVLINFDADYSAALEDEQQGGKKHELPENHAHKLVPDDLMAENNAITMEIGAYHGPRPQWDVQLLIEAGFERVTVDKGVYKRIYAEIDEFINPTPIFTIAAFK